jgi:hypothetical protein
MAEKKHDFGLILSLGLIIAIGGYWFVKEVQMDSVEHYIDLLGDKLVDLVPKETEKQELAEIYDEFKSKVKEKKIRPENVEQVASAIINLSNVSDSVTFAEAEALIRIAIPEIRVDSLDILHIPDIEATSEEWEALQDRLSSVYKAEELLHDKATSLPETSMPRYRIDEKLNVIIDNKVRADLKREELLKKLEDDKRLFWKDSVAESMEKELHKLEIELKTLSDEMDVQHHILKLQVLTRPIHEGIDIDIDSLDLVTILNLDSLEDIVTKEIEKYESQNNLDSEIKPKD